MNFLVYVVKGLIATFVAGVVAISGVFVHHKSNSQPNNQVSQQATSSVSTLALSSSTTDEKISELEKEIQDLKSSQQQKPSEQSNSSAETISNLQNQINQLKASSTASQTANQGNTLLSAAEVIQKVQPSVVLIRTDLGCGSGIIVQNNGTILTADHVINSASYINVYLNDGSMHSGYPIVENPGQDIALLKISGGVFIPANLGDSNVSSLPLGSGVISLGFPLNCDVAETIDAEPGIITSRKGLPDDANLGELLQTNARINPGDSGGPLVDYRGNVVGINEAMAISKMQSVFGNIFGEDLNITGLAYATPINAAKNFINNQSASQTNPIQQSPPQPSPSSVGATNNPRQFTVNGSGFCENNPGVSSIFLSGYPLVEDEDIPAIYIQFWDDNQITFTVPNSVPAGTYQVIVRGYNKLSGYCSNVKVSGMITIQ